MRRWRSNTFGSDSGRVVWLIWGARRTGSTVVFSIVRALFGSERKEFWSGYVTELNPKSLAGGHVIVKAHEEIAYPCSLPFSPANCVHIFFTVRRARDQLASIQRVFPGDYSRWRRELERTILILVAGLIVSFRTNVHLQVLRSEWSAEKKVASIAQSLPWDASREVELVAEEHEISVVKMKLDRQFGAGLDFEQDYDQVSHWHAGHVRDLTSKNQAERSHVFLFHLAIIAVLNWLISVRR